MFIEPCKEETVNGEKARCLSPVLLSHVRYQTYWTSREQISYLTNLNFSRPTFRIISLVLQEMLLNLCGAMGARCYVPAAGLPLPWVLLPIAPQNLRVPSCPVLSCPLTGGQVKGANTALGETGCRSPASPCSAGLTSPAPGVCVAHST